MNTPQVTQTSEIWHSSTERRNHVLSFPKMSNSVFFCKNCGSLEVFFTKENEKLVMKCLDCTNVDD